MRAGQVRTGILGIFACVAQLGCGDGSTGPGGGANAEPIPSYFYQVRLSGSQNTCGAKDPGTLGLLVLPFRESGTYTLEGIADAAIPVNVTVAVTGGSVTVSGDWKFPAGRHTFSGTTKYDVVLTGYRPCSFTFVTDGTHDITLSAPSTASNSISTTQSNLNIEAGAQTTAALSKGIPTLKGEFRSAERGAMTLSSQPAGWYWGSIGNYFVAPAVCLPIVGIRSQFYFNPPSPKSRSSVTEGVYFRFVLHGFNTATEAATALIAEEIKPFAVGNVGYDSGWWYTAVGSTGASYESFIFGQGLAWADYPSLTTPFSRSKAAHLELPVNSVWFATIDIYWPPANGRTFGQLHQVVPIGQSNTCSA
jgi:hypothetical protein